MTDLPPPSPAVTGPVEAAYDRYAQAAGQWLDRYAQQGGRVYCGAGCFACCNMPIRVSLAEALITASALDDDLRARVGAHARRVIENARTAPDDDTYVERHRTEVGYCPILNPVTGGCSRYAARPTRCRDTFSALPALYCAADTWEQLSPAERRAYHREVARTPGTDGELHYIAPLEYLSEPVWEEAAAAMSEQWGLQIWGDFWVLTTLAASGDFMAQVKLRRAKGPGKRLRPWALPTL
ncbi:YkgJ family cysteine cluster protein [Deinococcus lacus]|uniref:YkgJ family cysteine cluster protein n=1 Tax=Deinococcus lacus TaxID=392561 RepID=A0ABW1Y9S9_9DEIO